MRHEASLGGLAALRHSDCARGKPVWLQFHAVNQTELETKTGEREDGKPEALHLQISRRCAGIAAGVSARKSANGNLSKSRLLIVYGSSPLLRPVAPHLENW